MILPGYPALSDDFRQIEQSWGDGLPDEAHQILTRDLSSLSRRTLLHRVVKRTVAPNHLEADLKFVIPAAGKSGIPESELIVAAAALRIISGSPLAARFVRRFLGEVRVFASASATFDPFVWSWSPGAPLERGLVLSVYAIDTANSVAFTPEQLARSMLTGVATAMFDAMANGLTDGIGASVSAAELKAKHAHQFAAKTIPTMHGNAFDERVWMAAYYLANGRGGMSPTPSLPYDELIDRWEVVRNIMLFARFATSGDWVRELQEA